MFIRVIHGRAANAAALRVQFDRWFKELSPGAAGWHGTTAGLTADGRFFALPRFLSAEAAELNDRRPEQQQWWTDVLACCEGEVTVDPCTDVIPSLRGGKDIAPHVRITRGQVLDPTAVRDLNEQLEPMLAAVNADVYYGSIVLHEGNTFTQATYYLSDAARNREFQDLPDDVSALHRGLMVQKQHCRVSDLAEHWPYAPH